MGSSRKPPSSTYPTCRHGVRSVCLGGVRSAGHAHLRIDPLFERLDYERIIVPCPEVDGSESVRHGRLADQLGDIVLAVD
jgi:hypothetical protein